MHVGAMVDVLRVVCAGCSLVWIHVWIGVQGLRVCITLCHWNGRVRLWLLTGWHSWAVVGLWLVPLISCVNRQ